LRRGDIVTVSVPADYGKPRLAIVIQSDGLKAADSVLVCLLTSVLVEAPFYRLQIEPTSANGLKAPSQIMVDKIIAMPRGKCGKAVGRIDATSLIALNQWLAVVIGLAD
jgi:mRNA interferase MazF